MSTTDADSASGDPRNSSRANLVDVNGSASDGDSSDSASVTHDISFPQDKTTEGLVALLSSVVLAPSVQGGSRVVVPAQATKKAAVFMCIPVRDKVYAVVTGRAATDKGEVARLRVFVDRISPALLGTVEFGENDPRVWGRDFAVVGVDAGAPTPRPWSVRDEPATVMRRAQFMDFAQRHQVRQLCVAGRPGFVLGAIVNVGTDDLRVFERPPRPGRYFCLPVHSRLGHCFVIQRTTTQLPFPGDPVSVRVRSGHIVVGMVVAHRHRVHGTYIVQFLDDVIDAIQRTLQTTIEPPALAP